MRLRVLQLPLRLEQLSVLHAGPALEGVLLGERVQIGGPLQAADEGGELGRVLGSVLVTCLLKNLLKRGRRDVLVPSHGLEHRLERVRLSLLAVGDEQRARLRAVVDQLQEVLQRDPLFDVEQGVVHKVGVATLDGLVDCALGLADLQQQRHLLRHPRLELQQHRRQPLPVPLERIGCHRSDARPMTPLKLLHDRVAKLLVRGPVPLEDLLPRPMVQHPVDSEVLVLRDPASKEVVARVCEPGDQHLRGQRLVL
mmetsp:Transcript_3880/g.13620  ORF Transcript_3880/g.13620 Transcript_3880/m.13620 type:complete len:254 (+) Transcript_3880:1335-2096(+)